MRRAKRRFGGTYVIVPDQFPVFNSKKDRDAYEAHPLNKPKARKYQSKLPREVVRVPLFSERINTVIAEGKVKVYYSMVEFKNRNNGNV